MKHLHFSKITLFCLLSIVISFTACDKKIGKNQLPLIVNTPDAISECDTITYNKHIKKIIIQTCSSGPQCHTTGMERGNLTLDTYDDVKVNAAKIKETVFKGNPKTMPPIDDTTVISNNQKKLLNCWLSNGMKN
ncbi:MAG: hypothetical protein WCR21_02755 [Bacteroidota bacterium]